MWAKGPTIQRRSQISSTNHSTRRFVPSRRYAAEPKSGLEREKQVLELLKNRKPPPPLPPAQGLIYRPTLDVFDETSLSHHHVPELQSSPLMPFILPSPPGELGEIKGTWALTGGPVVEEEVFGSGPRDDIPVLHHGLQRVLDSPGVHAVKDLYSDGWNFDKSIRPIHNLAHLDFSRLPPFSPPSRDINLRATAQEKNCKFVASTSSLSSALSQVYFHISSFKLPNLDGLSAQVPLKVANFTQTYCKPSIINLRTSDGVTAIDAESSSSNTVLSDLGKSMERMLTTTPEEFTQRYVAAVNKNSKLPDVKPDYFNYVKQGDFLLRSQIDCWDDRSKDKPKLFDLKTRATREIRFDVENWALHRGYMLDCLSGKDRSYELEFYDIVRSALLKYVFQVRIGKMDGLFVTYHNVSEIFGFEYLNYKELEHYLFGNSDLGDFSFNMSMKVCQNIIRQISSDFPNKNLRVLWGTDAMKGLDVFVEVVGDKDEGWKEGNPQVPDMHNQIVGYRVNINLKQNGKPVAVIHHSKNKGEDITATMTMRKISTDVKRKYHQFLVLSAVFPEEFGEDALFKF
eukprot:TRINITY_DN1018_c1_g1_i1.p1 TRINITY_DN1018_c1_g1~~TRINITY_DN1018_c1_g1_i1.p1  ORF type:complete len:570 (-),score=145.15 TRINITY_DN1018_c1_g1_i1:82-1791(-)